MGIGSQVLIPSFSFVCCWASCLLFYLQIRGKPVIVLQSKLCRCYFSFLLVGSKNRIKYTGMVDHLISGHLAFTQPQNNQIMIWLNHSFSALSPLEDFLHVQVFWLRFAFSLVMNHVFTLKSVTLSVLGWTFYCKLNP